MSAKTDELARLEEEASAAMDLRLASTLEPLAAAELRLARWLASRAASGKPCAPMEIDPETGRPSTFAFKRQRNPYIPMLGWSGVLWQTFALIEESMESTGSPFAAWAWSESKTKFGTLRLSGQQMPAPEAAILVASKQAGIDLNGLRLSALRQTPEDIQPRLDPLKERLKAMGLSGSATIAGNGRVELPEPDQLLAQEALDASPQPDAEMLQSLVDIAEDITSRVCEHCGRPGSSVGQGWITTACERCSCDLSAAKNREIQHPIAQTPIFQLALLALANCAWRAGSRQRGAFDLDQDERLAMELAPIAKLAIHGADIDALLPQGASVAEYARSLPELLWLEAAGIGPLSPCGADRKTPTQRMLAANATLGSQVEAWLIAKSAANTPSAPKKSL